MKLKKFAMRALIILAICVALCMFFSGTIENITTPKVKLVKASRGKFIQNVELSAEVAYPETQEIRAAVPVGQTLSVNRVNVRVGYPVKAGDIIVEAAIAGYDAALQQAQGEYDAAMDALMEVERKNSGITLRRSEQHYADSYAALRNTRQACSRAELEMRILLRGAGLEYSETGYPENADENAVSAIDAYREALDAQNSAQAEFDEAARRGVDDAVWAYITEHQAAQEKLAACADKLMALEERNLAAKAICAPHDGYIAEIKLQNGDSYDGSAPLYVITAEGSEPILRADLSEVEQNIAEGMKVFMESSGGGSIETKIASVGYGSTGAKFADIVITGDMIRAAGSLYTLAQEPAKLNVQFKDKESTCLIPASAVRGSGDDRYVYIVNTSTTTFGKQKMNVSKMNVKVLAEADGTASLQDDISYYSVAYMEDRALSEGSAVMTYAGE